MNRAPRPGRFSSLASRITLLFGCIAVLLFPVSWERLPDFRPVYAHTPNQRPPYPGIDPTTDPETVDRIQPTPSTTTTVPGQPNVPTTTTQPPSQGEFAYFPDFGGKPPYISTCKPIEFVIRRNAGPTNGDQLVLEAIRRLADATGLEFEWKGFTDSMFDVNQRRTKYSWESDRDPLWIGWAAESEVPSFRSTDDPGGTVLGIGGPISISRADGTVEIIGGSVVLRSGGGLPQLFGPGETLGNVILHELGHAFGLDHVNAEDQLMNPSISNNSPDGYGPGEMLGLRSIVRGC